MQSLKQPVVICFLSLHTKLFSGSFSFWYHAWWPALDLFWVFSWEADFVVVICLRWCCEVEVLLHFISDPSPALFFCSWEVSYIPFNLVSALCHAAAPGWVLLTHQHIVSCHCEGVLWDQQDVQILEKSKVFLKSLTHGEMTRCSNFVSAPKSWTFE